MKKIRERSSGDMAKLQDMDPQHLSKFLENEHSQTVALVLAHLDAKRASVVLMNLQGAMRVDVVRRLAEMRQFSPEMAQTVAMALHKRMEKMGSSGRKSYSGFKAVAELLNRLNQTESRGILEEIEQSEPKLAIGIRELMFVFEDLVTVPAESIREFVSAADKKMLGDGAEGRQRQCEGAFVQGDEFARGRDVEGRHGGDGAGADERCRTGAAGAAGVGTAARERRKDDSEDGGR